MNDKEIVKRHTSMMVNFWIDCPHCGLGFWWSLVSKQIILDNLEIICLHCQKSVFLRAEKEAA